MNRAGATFKLRRDTATNWEQVNPVLAAGEPGLETNTRFVKYGDGVTPWNELEYSAISTAVSNVPPASATPGQLWFDNSMDQLKVYVESSGTWEPVAPKRIRYSFSESNNWIVEHNRNTTAYTVNLIDSDGDMFYAKISTIDNNSFSIVLTAATSGIADVTFM